MKNMFYGAMFLVISGNGLFSSDSSRDVSNASDRTQSQCIGNVYGGRQVPCAGGLSRENSQLSDEEEWMRDDTIAHDVEYANIEDALMSDVRNFHNVVLILLVLNAHNLMSHQPLHSTTGDLSVE